MKTRQTRTNMKVLLVTIFTLMGFSVGCTTKISEDEANTTTYQLDIFIDRSNNINNNIPFNIILFPLNCEYSKRIEYTVTTNEYIIVPEGIYNILIYGSEVNSLTNEHISYYDSYTHVEIKQNKINNRFSSTPRVVEKQLTFDWLYNSSEQIKNIIILSTNGKLSEGVMDIEVDVDEWEDSEDNNIEFA